MDRNASREEEEHSAKNGDYKQRSIQNWLNTNCTSLVSEDRPPSPQKPGISQRMSSTEDDLMLGVEATIYTSALQNMTFKEYVRTFHSEKHTLGRMNSTASATSVSIGPQSVFEFLDVWHSDPEEILLDLGFGKEEPEILTKIPGRYINGSSVATGINIRVFLDALKLRMEMENLDLYKKATQNSSPELSVVEMRILDVTKERRALLRKMSQSKLKNIKDSQTLEESRESKENTMKSLKRDRKNYFLYARRFTTEDDSILSPLTVGQSGEQKKAPDLLLDLKMSQDNPLLETSAKDKDGDMQFLIPQAKKLKCIMNDQLPDSFEMEEMQSFDEDGSLRMPANKICLDLKRENSCQSDSSGFVEEPFIPSQILHTLKNFGWDSRASSQESKQWPVHVSNPGQATDNITDPTPHSASADSDQAKCSEASTTLHISQEQEKITVENLDHNPHAFDDHQRITCIDKVTGEESELNDNNSHLPTTPFKATKHDSIADADVWKNNQTQKENDDIDNQNNNSVSMNAIIVNNISAIQQEPSLHLPHSTALSKLVTIQIPQEKLPEIVTDVHLSDPQPLLFQLSEDPVKPSAFQESGKLRDASVQTKYNTGELTVKTSQPDQIKMFQSVRKFTKSVSLDTGLYIVEQNTQNQTAITPVHCLCCHHCSCVQHCSSICFKTSNMKSPSKMAMSHSEAQLIKTLQQLQQTARVISGSPQVLREIETVKKCLRGFRNRLVDIEQDIIEQQASVYSVLTEQERDEVKRLQTLRRAVRQEVTEIEDQLEDQARQVGEAMKMQLLSLLEEQSSLCSYVEMMKQTRNFGSHSQHCPSSICMTSMPAAVSISQELESTAGRSISIHSTLAQCPINSPVTSASSKTDTEVCSEAAKGTDLSEKKQDHQAETLDFKNILKHIKQSFKHLRSAGSEKTEHTK